MRRMLPALALLFVVGCGGGAGLTIHNGRSADVQIEGLPSGTATVASGELHRVDGLSAALKLVARGADGADEVTVPLMTPGTEAVWSVGGMGCFVEGDFTAYYEMPPDVPASAAFVGMLKQGESLYVSRGKVQAAPGRRLPSSHGGDAVHALVQVPCDATVTEDIARAWLEMTLQDIEPK